MPSRHGTSRSGSAGRAQRGGAFDDHARPARSAWVGSGRLARTADPVRRDAGVRGPEWKQRDESGPP
ncbi:hypothetical protein, partial [Streptomyces hayashii]|uniref:hypothetical protein n=1 Tax=Streptomyces hayashii TaxID=2839966 RepID=UPI00403D4B1C